MVRSSRRPTEVGGSGAPSEGAPPGGGRTGDSPGPGGIGGGGGISGEQAKELLSLLVVTGGVKGSLAVVLGYLVGINALAQIHPDVASTVHGLEWAAPVALVDAFLMMPTWDLTEEEEDAIDAKRKQLGKPEKIRRALSRYQREEALSNPCRAMPAWQDALVGAVARLTDEMLERAVVVGFIGAWICDRAVEAGADPYDAESPAKFAACVAVYAYLEWKLRRDNRRNRQTMRAFRVQRDKITGKQKMVPMDEEELDKVMGKGKGAEGGGGVPKGLGGFGVPERKKTVDALKNAARRQDIPREVADEVAGMVEGIIGEESEARRRGLTADDERDEAIRVARELTPAAPSAGKGVPTAPPAPPPSQRDGPLVMSPGQLGASPVGSLMFNASVKQFFDGFRSRLTLVTSCLCYVTAPGMNLWAPVAGGFVCDLMFIVYQRNAMNRFFAAAEVEKPAGPPSEKAIKRAQMRLLKRDLDRRRRALASQLMDSVDNSVAAGAKEFNVLMREVVKEVREAKGYEREDVALTEVLDAIHKKFPPSELAKMSEQESVAKMREVLMEIRAELGGVKMEEDAETAAGTTEVKDAEVEGADNGGSKAFSDAKVDDVVAVDETGEGVEKAGNANERRMAKEMKPLNVRDLASLAGAVEPPPLVTLQEAIKAEREEAAEVAAKKREDEEKAKEHEMEEEDEKERAEAKPEEPASRAARTLSALERLTSEVSKTLDEKK